MSKDSDSDDDSFSEQLNNLLASADTSLFAENLYKQKNDQLVDDIKSKVPATPNPTTEICPTKSQRYIDVEENCLDSELNIPTSMQNYFAKKVSEYIEQEVKFIDEKIITNKKERKIKDYTKLLSLSDNSINIDAKDTINYPKCRPKIIKYKIEDENELTEELKIKSVVVDGDFILNQTDCKNWIDTKKSKIFNYKSKSGNPYQYIEDDNEFSILRKKNVWNVKKIARRKN